jgi:YggT family protein
MADNFANAGVYLIQTFFGLYTMALMLRFLMQVSRVDYYNPISQAIVKVTDPAINPFRSVIPNVRGIEFATIATAFAVQLIAVMLILMLWGAPFFSPIYLAWVMLGLFSIVFKIYFFALIVLVISSWIAPQSSHPALNLVHQITEPICIPARKLLPPMGGMDFSIILVFVFINIIDNILVIAPLVKTLGVPGNLIFGL